VTGAIVHGTSVEYLAWLDGACSIFTSVTVYALLIARMALHVL
jgi:hypothetical protein